MTQALKEYAVIMLIASLVFAFCRPALAHPQDRRNLDRRLVTWSLITTAGLLTPSIFLYMGIALPVLMWHQQKDDNPAAVYVLLYLAIPHYGVPLPTIVINQLFDISHGRFLSLAFLLPAMLRLRANPGKTSIPKHPAQWGVAVFIGLIILFVSPYYSITHLLRTFVTLSLDWLIPFLACVLLANTSDKIRDCMKMWALSGAILGAIAMFESSRTWLLFDPISLRWGSTNAFAYLFREGTLRAQATAGHSLALGYWLAIAWGFHIHLYRSLPNRRAALLMGGLILGGLIATWSRGPWLTAILITIIYLALDPRGASSIIKSLGALVFVATAVYISPYWDAIKRYIPFVGNVDSANVEYRQRLFQTAIEYIKLNPLTGNPLVLQYLESLRQGQGIIDLMNGYIQIAMFYGLICLAGFLVMLLGPVASSIRLWQTNRSRAPATAWEAAVFIATLTGTAVFIATASYGGVTFYLAGMAVAFLRTAPRQSAGTTTSGTGPDKHAAFQFAHSHMPQPHAHSSAHR
jgi:hypothetical protein